MGVLVDGKWSDGELPQETSQTGQFKRADSVFRDCITADGSSGFKAEPGRYHLYVAHGCPWAHRTLIYRAVKKLEGLISVAYAIPGLKQNGWTFERDPRFPDCIPDEINGFHYLYEAYVASNPAYTGKVTVPTLWDKKTKRIVNNKFVRDHPDAQHRIQRDHRRPHGPLSAGLTFRDRRPQRTHLSQRQQWRIPRWVRENSSRL